MLQPACRVLPSNAPPLRDDGDVVQHASRVLQEHSGNRQQNGYQALTICEPKYAIPAQTENSWPTYPQYQQHVHYAPTQYGQQYVARSRHSPYDYQHPDDERNDIKKAADLYKRFQDCQGYTKYRSRQQKDNKAGQEQKWPDHLEEAFFRALVKYPPMGRRKWFHKDKQRGRNELIADYIQQLTGVERGRKQVSSHIQVLKPFVEGVPQIMRYLSKEDMGRTPGNRHCSSHHGSAYTSGRRMSTYPAAGPSYDTRGAARPTNPQADMESIRNFKHRLDFFEPKKFEMFVQRKFELSDGQTQEERLHTYTQSIDAPLGDEVQLADWQALSLNYPLLAAKHTQKPLDCNVVVADASIGFPTESFRDLSGVELGISFVCSSSHLPQEAKVRCRNSFYRKGERLSEEAFDAPLQMMEDGRSVSTSLKFGSSFWARMLHQLAARLMKGPTGADHETSEAVRNDLAGLTALLEVVVVFQHGHERILVMSWTFRKSSVATGRASWKRLLMPQTATQYPEPAKSERVDSVYDYASQYAGVPLEVPVLEVSSHPTLQSPFEYDSSTGSALSSATWPMSTSEASLNAQVSGVTDFSVDNSFDLNAGSINLSYDPSLLDFSNFNSCVGFDNATFNFGTAADFTDPALDQYSQQWYDNFDAQAPLSAVSADTQHCVPAAQMDGSVPQAYPDYSADYEQSLLYPVAQEQQAYGGAGQDAGRGHPRDALADASYIRSMMPKSEPM